MLRNIEIALTSLHHIIELKGCSCVIFGSVVAVGVLTGSTFKGIFPVWRGRSEFSTEDFRLCLGRNPHVLAESVT